MSVKVANYLYWVVVQVYETEYPTSNVIERLEWDNLPFHVRTKWGWYFQYRAALAQVQHPKSLVKFHWGNKPPDKRTRADFLKQSITSKKRMITKLSNEIKLHIDWLEKNDIFGVAGDDGRLPKAEAKLCKYQKELDELQNELNTLTNE